MERRNKTVQEVVRSMLNEAKLLDVYWREEVYAIVYILNRGKLILNNDKTPYHLWYGRLGSVKYFRVFGSKCYIKRNEDDLGKFDFITDEGIFLGYSSTKKAYICYNQRIHKIIESADVRVDDMKPRRVRSQDDDERTNDEEEK